MSNKELLKQIYLQALSNRQDNISLAQKQQSKPRQVRLKQAVAPQAVSRQAAPAKVSAPVKTPVRAIDQPDSMPKDFNEREQILHDVIGVYRQKRQMIDDLPPKHRLLLEKVGRLMLGVTDDKQPPNGH